jgi:pseudouridine-5'-phosphate glycosidase
MSAALLDVRPEVAAAVRDRRPAVALESTLISHGLPWPDNLETALAAEEAVRAEGALPATIAVLAGRPTVGLGRAELERLARSPGVRKASRRDLAAAVAQGADAGTTVAATLALARRAGLVVFATGGIGGVHPARNSELGARNSSAPHSEFRVPSSWDVSADLPELARNPVAVVCAGAKSILDLPATLEVLETLGAPVVGYGTDTFPAFLLASSGLPVSARVDSPDEAAALLAAHWALGGGGVLLAQPLPAADALDPEAYSAALADAEREAAAAGVRGPALTPFLLAGLAARTAGAAVRANRALIVANARLAARVAAALSRRELDAHPGDR